MSDEQGSGPADEFHAEAADEPEPEVARLLKLLDALDAPDLHELEPAAAREAYDSFFAVGDPAAEVGGVEDRTIPGPAGDLPVRIYDPPGDDGGDGTPVVVFLHGGGFIVGGLDSYDDLCRVLCAAAEAVVVSVDYRLAPEHRFPAAAEDAYAASAWVGEHARSLGGDPERLVVAGDSAGGNLAAVVSLLARDRDRRGEDAPSIAGQVLLYPTTDLESYPSREAFADGYFVTGPDLAYFYDNYLDHDLHGYNKYAFPMNARDLSDLPPATVVTAGFDPLRDEGAAYAGRLHEAGVPVRFRNYGGMIHGFAGMLGRFELARAREAVDAVAADLDAIIE